MSTARIGSVDVTEFFGIRAGASGFAQNFGGPDQTVVQRCIRLEVDNPAPSDLLPVGGYVLAQSNSGRVGTIAVPVIVGNLTPAAPTRTP